MTRYEHIEKIIKLLNCPETEILKFLFDSDKLYYKICRGNNKNTNSRTYASSDELKEAYAMGPESARVKIVAFILGRHAEY